MNYDYDQFFEDKLKLIAKNSVDILDVGGGEPFQKILGKHKDILKDKNYITLDIDPKTNPTVVGDAHHLPFADSSFDAVTHIYVFEHLRDPFLVAREIYRVLRTDGYMLGIVPFLHPYHARKDGYRDYWRFSKDGLNVLFGEFKNVEIYKIGRYFRAMIGFLPFLWRARQLLESFAFIADRLLIDERRNTTAGYIIFCQK